MAGLPAPASALNRRQIMNHRISTERSSAGDVAATVAGGMTSTWSRLTSDLGSSRLMLLNIGKPAVLSFVALLTMAVSAPAHAAGTGTGGWDVVIADSSL